MLVFRGGELKDAESNDKLSASPMAIVAVGYIEYREYPVVLIYEVEDDEKVLDFSASGMVPEVTVTKEDLVAVCDPLAVREIADRTNPAKGIFENQKYRFWEIASAVGGRSYVQRKTRKTERRGRNVDR